jgi:glutamate--cysteine ligase
MMKGTASIHLHVVISNFKNLLPLFNMLCELSVDQYFAMSWSRRNIWDHTDPTRCGRPPCCFAELKTPDELIHRLIRFALQAEVLGENVPFTEAADQSFESFLVHMTTIFTDVRFNLKGPTLELRTMNSIPTPRFADRWKRFIKTMERV